MENKKDFEAKDIEVKSVEPRIARAFVKKNHYSHKVVQNSSVHLGVFLNGVLHGMMQFGPSTDKRKLIGLVEGTAWNGFIELNRMVFDDKLPRNSESRAISVALREFKKHAPHIKWVISFADGCQCGSGTIYRASGFVLTQIKENKNLSIDPETGEVHAQLTFSANRPNEMKKFKTWPKLKGYQLRYIYFMDDETRQRLTCPIIPFRDLDDLEFPREVRHKEHLKKLAKKQSAPVV